MIEQLIDLLSLLSDEPSQPFVHQSFRFFTFLFTDICQGKQFGAKPEYTHRTSRFGFYNPSSCLLPAGEGIDAEF
jgi:hypothetical protein